ETPLSPVESSGIWTGFVPDLTPGALYKYRIWSRHHGYRVDKADPFGFRHETPPRTASMVWDLGDAWGDGDWMRERRSRQSHESPIAIYEVHLGSWRRVPEEGDRPRTYREIAPLLADHVQRLGFTH